MIILLLGNGPPKPYTLPFHNGGMQDNILSQVFRLHDIGYIDNCKCEVCLAQLFNLKQESFFLFN